MWRAALPCRRTGSAVGATAIAAALAFAASASGTQGSTFRPLGSGVGDGTSRRRLVGEPAAAQVACGQGREHGRHGRDAAEATRAAGRVGEARAHHGDRGPHDSSQACLRGTGRHAPDLRRARAHSRRRRQARPALRRRLRRRPRRRPEAAALPPRRPLQAEPDRRAAAASERGGLAHGRRLRDRGRLARSRRQLPSVLACPERLRRSAAAAAHGDRCRAGGARARFSSSDARARASSLRWTASPGAVDGYGVYRDGEFVLNVSGSAITVTGLACGRTYALRDRRLSRLQPLRADLDDGDDGCAVAAAAAVATPADAVPPTVPTALAKSSSTQTSIRVVWSASTDNVGVAGYRLYRGGALAGTSLVVDYTFSGLACGTSYALEVAAYDAAGNTSARAALTAATNACSGGGDTTAPSLPGALSVTGSTTTSISVSWGASTDNVGVSGYGLYRNNASTGSTAATSATFGGLVCGSSYSLAVDAYDAAGNRSAKRSLTAATAACPPSADTQAPSVPQGMAFTTITQTTVGLTWLPSTDNVGVAGYRLLRNGASVATVSTPGYTYVGLSCGTAYTFTLQAYDAAGNSSNGAEATGSTTTAACGGGSPRRPPPPPPPSSPGRGRSTWLRAGIWIPPTRRRRTAG